MKTEQPLSYNAFAKPRPIPGVELTVSWSLKFEHHSVLTRASASNDRFLALWIHWRHF